MEPEAAVRRYKFAAFMEDSTIHGLAEIARSKSFERAIYLTAFAICIGFSCYGCFQIIYQYLEKPIATTYFILEADNLSLPDITICPFNRMDHRFLNENNISVDLAKYIQWAFAPTSTRYAFANYDVGKLIRLEDPFLPKQLNETMERLNVTFEELVHMASLNCSDIVNNCVMGTRLVPWCCSKSEAIMTGFGKCHRLNGELQTSSGYAQGFTLIMSLPVERFTIGENIAVNDGLLLKLAEPGKGYEFDAIFLPVNVHVLVQLRATQLDFMNNPPQYQCLKDPDEDYAPLMCTYQCIFGPAYKACNCRYIGAPATDENQHLNVCTPDRMLNCAYQALGKFHELNPDFARMCKRKCKPRCQYWKYQSTVSHADYPSQLAQAVFHKHFDNRTVKAKQPVILEIFYEKLEYTLIKHYPSVTMDQFIADIGGQIGLWVGASVLSVIHLLVFLAQRLRAHFSEERPPAERQNTKKRKRHRNSVPNGSVRQSPVDPGPGEHERFLAGNPLPPATPANYSEWYRYTDPTVRTHYATVLNEPALNSKERVYI